MKWNSETLKRDANRYVTLTYMVSGCLGYAIENMENLLERSSLKLAGKDKYLFNRLKPALKRVQFLLQDLENESMKVMTQDPSGDDVLAYEDAVHIYWYMFLLLVDRGGTDSKYDLRLKALCDMIEKYKSLLDIPGMALARFAAFNQVEKAIEEGKYSTNDYKNLLEYESKDKTSKG